MSGAISRKIVETIKRLQSEAEWQRAAELSADRPAAKRNARRLAEDCERQIRSLLIRQSDLERSGT